ncbi:hypothetical protein PACTADRAFT_45786 [Pachysolen tannophilus NRRL Y-2460]|uniref:Enhancer of polycomb-like protein n=1 Tax=Pachysolen tannophilus NRRL Y-2460 TaxID=669874 RepID=A0A1E4TPW2_PACTA|nr:hypothetical protein PACTADRAFT_45786 [Pachysolen tannophilus NRRL Y-2460]
MAPPSSAGARFRQRKISVKQTLQVLKQSDLPDLETEDQQRELQQIETGVEKGEEEEEHLQKVINAARAKIAGSQVEQVYIPTPDASKTWPEASKYYTGTFVLPATYIKFSATVEDTCGCPYNMDEEDEIFLKILNSSLPADNIKLTESEFEIISYNFEKVINDKQPFLETDPQSIFSYEEIKSYALNENSKADIAKSLQNELKLHNFKTLFDAEPIDGKQPRILKDLLDKYGEKVYKHWKERRLARNGRPIFPALRFEDPNENNDSDPYICFRHRTIRSVRKTRKSDLQNSESLHKLYIELKNARELVYMCALREAKRYNALKIEKNIFNLRSQVKEVKRKLGIKGEEEDLIPHKKKKIIPPPEIKRDEIKDTSKPEKAKLGRPPLHTSNLNQQNQVAQSQKTDIAKKQLLAAGGTIQPYVRLPTSKIPDMDLVTVQAILNEKESAIVRAVSEKLKRRQEQDAGWVNITDDPYNPFFDIEQPYRKVIEQSNVPFSSITTALYDVKAAHFIDEELSDLIKRKECLPNMLAFNSSNGDLIPAPAPEYYQLISDEKINVSEPIMQLKKRIGRSGIMYCDRKLKRPHDEIDEFLSFTDSEDEIEPQLEPEPEPEPKPKQRIPNVYDCKSDASLRLKTRWFFDNKSMSSIDVSLDPSRLNNISSQTQSIRFGSMILSKSLHNMQQQYRNYFQALHGNHHHNNNNNNSNSTNNSISNGANSNNNNNSNSGNIVNNKNNVPALVNGVKK